MIDKLPPHQRWHEFFEGPLGRLSMSRLLCFLAFWPSSVVVLLDRSAETLGYFVGAFVIGYVGGKGADALSSRKGQDNVADS